MAKKLQENLTEKYVILTNNRMFFCKSGYGIVPNSNGNKIFGIFMDSNEPATVKRYEVERLAKFDEIEAALLRHKKKEEYFRGK